MPKPKLFIASSLKQIKKVMSTSNLTCLKMTFLVMLLNLMLILSLVWLTRPILKNSSIYVQDTRVMVRLETPDKYKEYQEDRKVEFNPSRGVLDESREYKSFMFSVVGDSWASLSSARSVCLGAQASVERLYEVVEMVKGWSGPVSVAVFVPGIDLAIGLTYIQYLRYCHHGVHSQVVFHLAYPLQYQGILHTNISFSTQCKDKKKVMDKLLQLRTKEMLAWRESYPYPQNLLREPSTCYLVLNIS